MKKLIFSVLLLLMTVIGAVAQTTVTIGEGTSTQNYPLPGYYGWNYNVFLYTPTTAAALDADCEISSIAFNVSSNSTSAGAKLSIWVKDVAADYALATATTFGEYTTGATLVYESNDLSTTTGWNTFDFTSDFSHEGGKSLLVAVRGEGCTDNGGCSRSCYYTSVSGTYWSKNQDYSDPGTEVSGNLSSNRANIQLELTYTGAVCLTPSGLTSSNITHNTATLSWSENGTATAWVLQYGTDNTFASGTYTEVSVNTNPTSDLSGLTALTTYYARVKPDCDAEGARWSSIFTFSTTAEATVVGDGWSDNFEGATCEWELINGTLTNAWAWGTATSNGGTHALYISDDGGVTNEYNGNNAAMVYATKLLSFANGKYEFSYDWNANGESDYDYLRVALVPASVTLTAGTSTPSGFSINSLPTGWIALDGGGKLNLVDSWQTKELAVNVTAGNYYLVFAWRDDTSTGNQPPAAVDNVSITRMTCAYDVTNLAVSNISTMGATIAWTAGEASQWQVAYSTSSDFAGAVEEIVNAATYNMTSLTSASTYYVKVRAYCGGTDFGAWSSVLEFNTACDAITSFPWNENFDGFTVASAYTPSSRTLPVCWNYINECSNSSYMYYPTIYYYSYTDYSHSTPNSIRLYSYYYYDPQPQYLILPAMENLDTKRIVLWARGYNANSTFKIGLMTDPTDASTFVQIGEELALTTSYQKFTINLTGTGNYIAIMIDAANSGRTYNGVYIDDITVEEIPSCVEPSALAVSNVLARTADLSWTAGGTETAWQICLDGDEDHLIDADSNPFTLTGLTPEHAYTVKVRANCGGDVSAWTSNISFTTTVACPVPTALAYADVTTNSVVLSWTAGASETAWQICVNNEEDDLIDVTENPYTLTGLDPATTYSVKVRANCGDTDGNSQWTSAVLFSTSCLAITELPYTESFESETCPASCWSIEYAVANPASSNIMKHVTDYAKDGSRSFRFSSYSSASDYNQYLISPMFDIEGSYLVSFYYRQYSTNEHLYFGTSSTGSNISDFTWTSEEIPAYSATWTLYKTIVPAGTKYFAINYRPGGCLYYAWIDNIVVREVSTAAEILTYSLPTEAAPAIITSGANAGTIDITVTFSTDFDADLNPSYTISDYAEISAPVITGDGDSRTITYTVTAEAGNHKDWTVNVTKVPVSRDAFITGFTFAGQKAGTEAVIVSDAESNTYTVHAVAEWNVDLTNIAPEITISPAAEITPESGYARDFSSPVPYTVTAEDGTTFHIYSVTIINDPDACVNPLAVNADDVTATTATLSWAQAYTETSYIVKVSTEAMTNMAATADVFDGTVDATTKALEGLTANTQYFVYVQSNCDNAEGWTEYSFRTECGVFAVPFVETFENNSETVNCWTAISNNTENDVASGKMGIYDRSGNNVFRFSSFSQASNENYNQYLITPELALTEDAVLTFDYAKSSSSNENFRVMTSTTDRNIASFTALGADVTATSTNFAEYRIVVPAATKYIAINYFSDYQYYLYVDNFKLTNVYTIAASAGANGSISQDGNVEVEYGESQSFTITPDECYHIASVLVDGVEAISNVDENGVYTFDNVNAAHTIAATFALNTYNITTSVVGNGTITESCVANCGENKSFAIQPQGNCYRIASFTVDGVDAIIDLDENGVYAMQNITADHELVATFEQITYTITATAGENGTITETSTVNCGADKEITITPANCYRIASVLVDDVDVTATVVAANGVYTFENVIANHTIAATFEQITYTFTVNAGANGSITANDGNGNVANCGEIKSFTIAANDCYHVVSVMVDDNVDVTDAVIAANGVYTFENVNAAHTIAATFAINTYAITTTVEGNGTITETSTVNCGANKEITITPASNCYRIASVIVDETENVTEAVIAANGVYTFENVIADHNIAATFEQITYTITATAEGEGTITEPSTVNCGADKEITITPANCYRIASVLVDDVNVTATVVAANGVYTFENVIANHNIAATFEQITYAITTTADANGTITETSTVNCGANKEITIAPANCYRIASVMVDGNVDVTEAVIAANGVYTFENVTADHTIAAIFAINTYAITTTVEGNGTITETSTVNCGANKEITITPASNCYRIASVIVDETENVTEAVIAANGVYTFENVIADHNIAATFEQITYTITATAEGEGTITEPSTVNCGADKEITITPANCYRIASVLVDDVNVTATVVAANGVYTFENVIADHNIAATFAISTYNITATAGEGGSITANDGNGNVANCGENKAFTITANEGYRIASVIVDETENVTEAVIAAEGVYTFENVTADHSIAATFELIPANTYTITATAGVGGTITPNGEVTVYEGDNKSFSIVANGGYRIASVLVDEVDVTATVIAANGVYTFTNVNANHTIAATFEAIPTYTLTIHYVKADNTPAAEDYVGTFAEGEEYMVVSPVINGYTADQLIVSGAMPAHDEVVNVTYTINTYTITATAGANGTITPEEATVNYGASQAFTISANEGYRIVSVMVDESENVTEQLVDGVYTFVNVTANHTIAATFEAIPTYTITATANDGGSITPAEMTVVEGGNAEFTIVANDGFRIVSVIVDETENVTALLVDGVYTFVNVTANHTIAATFEAIPTYTITATANDGGSITPAEMTVVEGGNAAFTIEAATGYHIVSVIVDAATENEVDVTSELVNGVYTFTNVTANHTINATFAINTYVITATAGENGTITPNGEVNVNYGATQTFSISANGGYRIMSVLVDGAEAISELVEGVYTFTNVTANHTIAATFVSETATTHTITATAGENGTITPAGAIEVVEGENKSFTIEAATGYHIVSVMVDETENVTEQLVNGVYTFENVTADHTIAAAFAINNYIITATAGDNGTITPAQVSVNHGASQEFTILANEGYRIASVIVDETEDVTEELVEGVYTFVNVTANHAIHATFEAIPTYTITATAGEGGAINPAEVTVVEGGNAEFTITANEGFRIASVIVDATTENEANVTEQLVEGVYTFANVTANHTIAATFEAIPTYTITATAGEGGSINPAEVTVVEGGNAEFTITANEGYRIASVIVDATTENEANVTEQLVEGVYTFANVTANHTIAATFEAVSGPVTYTITVNAGENGTVKYNDEEVTAPVVVNEGATPAFVITPAENYQIGTLTVDEEEFTLTTEELAGYTYTFEAVEGDHTLTVTFVPVSSAEMFEVGSMTVYPNPNNGMFSIDFSNIEGDATYQIINASGAVVETRDINVMNGETMNFNHDLRPGAYFVRIINGDKVYVEQIVVE